MGQASETSKSLHETATDAKAGLNVSTEPSSLAFKIVGSANARRSTSKANLHTVTIAGRLYLPFTEIARTLRELLGSVAAETLVVMIDEWSSIDLEVQPHLAQLIKRLRQSSASPVPPAGP